MEPTGDRPDAISRPEVTEIERRLARNALRAEMFGAAPEPVRIGRYAIEKRLGAGGMGTVYRARDEELARVVAIKVLHHGDLGAGDRRLAREAQAMAQLSHPNVVQVHDVGTVEGQVFVAMELVDGETLRVWLRSERTWREIVEVFLQAGRGLAAAHAAGLVHRDFKPENVLVGEDGRVRVLDFGLARGPAQGGSERPAAAIIGPASTLAGTPAYLAPELIERGTYDARSDQFSFCVALFEALYAARPFQGESVPELLTAITEGSPGERPQGASAPQWLDHVIRRGLARDPDERWPSMDALLDACTTRLQRRSRGLWALGSVLFLVAVLILATRSPMACQALDEPMLAVWNDEVAAQVEGALVPESEALVGLLRDELDARSGRWTSAAQDACQAHTDGQLSTELYDLQVACLERVRGGFAALVEVLGESNTQTVNDALQAVYRLDNAEDCADLDALLLRARSLAPPDDEETRVHVEAARSKLQRVRALHDTGVFPAALALANEIEVTAQAIAYPPLTAEALAHLGREQEASGLHEDAQQTLLRGLWIAEETNHNEVLLDILSELVRVLGEAQSLPDEALRWSQLARARLRRTRPRDAGRLAALLNRRAAVFMRRGEFARARTEFEASLEHLARLHGHEHHAYGQALHNVATALDELGQLDDAREKYLESLAILAQTLGEEDPALAVCLNSLGSLERRLGRLDAAQAYLDRARALLERAGMTGHEKYGLILVALGSLAEDREQWELADERYREALTALEHALGPRHTFVAMTRMNQGNVLRARGHQLEAIAAYRQSLATLEALAVDASLISMVLVNLGESLVEVADYAGANEVLLRALSLTEDSRGSDDPQLAEPLTALGRLELARGDCQAARTRLRRAASLQSKAETAPSERRETQRLLVSALAASSDASERALARELMSTHNDNPAIELPAGEERETLARTECRLP